MSTLQVHITAGPQAGARFQLNQSPVSFGRSPDNTLVLDVSVVSRQHGQLQRLDDGSWVLVNLSTNGTRVGRKKATKKPVPLTDGAPIIIGDTEVFRVHLLHDNPDATPAFAAAAHDDHHDQPEAHMPGADLKGKSKLWIGLGAWFGFMLLLFIILFVVFKTGPEKPRPSAGGNYIWNPGHNIEGMDPGPQADYTEVRRLLADPPKAQNPDDSRYNFHLIEARAASNQGRRGLYPAYENFQKAISFADNRTDPLDSSDQILYDKTLDALADIIATEYRRAYRDYTGGRYAEVRDLLDDLRAYYYNVSDPDDELANHIRTLRNAAFQRIGR